MDYRREERAETALARWGFAACEPRLPNRTRGAISAQVQLLGLRRKTELEIAGVTEEFVVEQFLQIRNRRKTAKVVGVSQFIVKKVLDKHGIGRLSNRRIDRMKDEVIADHLANVLTLSQICAKYGISLSELNRAIRRWGVINPTRYTSTRGDVNARRQGKSTHQLWTERYGKEEADRRQARYIVKISEASSGSNNPMYGRPCPQGAGNGWKGWYRGHYFRSLREACFMIRMDEEGLAWVTGETLSIPYILNGVQRTYRPDFLVGKEMIEIKPKRLHQSPAVVAKAQAAQKYCAENGLIHRLTDEPIDAEAILHALDMGDVRFARDYEARFRAFLNDAR